MRGCLHGLMGLVLLGSASAAGCEWADGIGDPLRFRARDGAAVDTGVPQEDPQNSELDGGVSHASDSAAPAGDASDDVYRGCPQDADAAMVRIDAPLRSFCIDVTEVTRRAFSVYRLKQPELSEHVPAACARSDIRTQATAFPEGLSPEHPVTGINFCMAWDYCNSIGRRLCGDVSGGPVKSSSTSEWYFVCSNGLAFATFPYGDAFDPTACVTGASGPEPVRSHARCNGRTLPFSLVFDMSGNVSELEDRVNANPGSLPEVFARGGAYDNGDAAGCASTESFSMYTTGTRSPIDFGFRCCADVR